MKASVFNAEVRRTYDARIPFPCTVTEAGNWVRGMVVQYHPKVSVHRA